MPIHKIEPNLIPHIINIKTCYDNESRRNIKELSNTYNNYDHLFDLLNNLTKGQLTLEKLSAKKVLIKPNLVMHNKKNDDEICLRTNDNFILAVLEIILRKKPAKVVIGDAPIQGCYWNQVIKKPFLDRIHKLGIEYNTPIEIRDFRRTTFDPKLNNPPKERKPLSDYIIFDLGKDSTLEPVSNYTKKLFRVTDYSPNRLYDSHSPGVHRYCIVKELFESDVIISLPKVKTHQKTGLTNALKNLVGLNGDKEFLPHHRRGGTKTGGDCYPGFHPLLSLAEHVLDHANKTQGKWIYPVLCKAAIILWKLSLPSKYQNLSAAWYGNDTTWRMVLDINKIAIYGKADGTLSESPQRLVYSICDGIIAGQGDGPLNPDPLPLGIICSSNNTYLTDVIVSQLLRFNIEKIPLIKNALTKQKWSNVSIVLNNRKSSLLELKKISIKTIPPPGWVRYL
jgi:uncharacterized protein (DUF362 family)